MEPVYTPVVGFARLAFAVQGLRFRIEGAHHVPRQGGALLAVNHVGYLDFAYAGLAALPAGRLVRFMAKQSVFTHPVSGPLMRGMKHISVDREAGASSLRAGLEALRRGELVGVFPEATISRSFELKAFKTGAVRMAQAARVPILPTIVWGSQRVWTKGHPRRLGRSRVPISLTVGSPMTVGADDDPVRATSRLRAVMEQLLHQAQAVYPQMPADERVFLPARLGGLAPTPEQVEQLAREEARVRAARHLERR